jgi:hypothetical protein
MPSVVLLSCPKNYLSKNSREKGSREFVLMTFSLCPTYGLKVDFVGKFYR